MNMFKKTSALAIILLVATNIFAESTKDTITIIKSDTTIIVDEVLISKDQELNISEIDTSYQLFQSDIELAKGDFDFLVVDSDIVRTLDSLLYVRFYQENFFSVDTSIMTDYGFKHDEVPTYPDSIYEQRIEALNRETPFGSLYPLSECIDLHQL